MKIEGDYDEQDWFGDVRIDGRTISPKRSQKVFNHSPGGFAWGYGGSGPAQLALAILLEAGLSDEQAIAFHQNFKWTFIATLEKNNFTIDIDIKAWINSHAWSGPAI